MFLERCSRRSDQLLYAKKTEMIMRVVKVKKEFDIFIPNRDVRRGVCIRARTILNDVMPAPFPVPEGTGRVGSGKIPDPKF